MLLDLLYQVNPENPTIKETIQVLELLQFMGWSKVDEKMMILNAQQIVLTTFATILLAKFLPWKELNWWTY